MNYSTATTSQMVNYKQSGQWITLGEMISFWNLAGILLVQDTSQNVDFIRIHVKDHAITMIHSKDSNGAPRDVLSLAIYKGHSWSRRDPIFHSNDKSTIMTKLQEFF